MKLSAILLLACIVYATPPVPDLQGPDHLNHPIARNFVPIHQSAINAPSHDEDAQIQLRIDTNTDINADADTGNHAAIDPDTDGNTDASAAADPIIDHPPSIRQNTIRRPSFPKSCPCKQIKARPGKCYYFINSLKPRNKYKCKSRTCVPRYVCIPRIVAKKIAKKFGKKLLMCIRRVTRKRIVPWIRKGRKGYCKSIRTRRRVFYVPYVRNSGRSL